MFEEPEGLLTWIYHIDGDRLTMILEHVRVAGRTVPGDGETMVLRRTE